MKEIKVDATLKPSAKIILSEKQAVTDPYTTKSKKRVEKIDPTESRR